MKGLTHSKHLGRKGIEVVLGAGVLFIAEYVVLSPLETKVEVLGDLVFLLTSKVRLVNNQRSPLLLLGAGYTGERAGAGSIERVEAEVADDLLTPGLTLTGIR